MESRVEDSVNSVPKQKTYNSSTKRKLHNMFTFYILPSTPHGMWDDWKAVCCQQALLIVTLGTMANATLHYDCQTIAITNIESTKTKFWQFFLAQISLFTSWWRWSQLDFSFFKWANPGLFFVYFRSPQQATQFLQQINVKKCILCRDSNPRPLKHESSHITTRPGLPP